MIIIRIQGGLGNQMFQYAMGRALSFLHNKKLYLDTSGLGKPIEGHLERGFMLDNFNINALILSPEKLLSFKKGSFWRKLSGKQKKYIKQLVFEEVPENNSPIKDAQLIVKHATYLFYPDIKEIKEGDIYLDGYWQSYKYFNSIKDILNKEFQIKCTLSSQAQKMKDKIQSCLSISVHIRRTDYISTEYGQKFYNTISMGYYNKAIEIFKSKYNKIIIFVFSDEIEWCKANFISGQEIYYISNNKNPIEDLHLMSYCKHNIISNSTFSWWAAWINSNPDKIVVSPSKWYKNVENDNIDDLLPKEWIKID